jgi:hypothetical protein
LPSSVNRNDHLNQQSGPRLPTERWASWLPQQKASTQLQSPFFSKLPLEIRILIYEYVIRSWGWGNKVHIVSEFQIGHLSPTPWESSSTSEPEGDKLTCVPCAADLGDPFQITGTHYGHWPRGHLACSRIASWRTATPIDGPPKPKGYGLASCQLSMFLTCQRVYTFLP